MMKSSGACRLAATVCPGSTDFFTTMPSTGARMVVVLEVHPRLRELRFALLHQRLDIAHLRLARGELRLRGLQLLARPSNAACALSSTAAETKFFS